MIDELKEIVESQIEAKREQELDRIERQINADRQVIDRAIELINSHTLYKRVKDKGNQVYKLATEEMFKTDYLKETEYAWQKGIKFHEDYFSEKVNKGVIEVNGECYYDIRYALNEYEKSVQKQESSLSYLNDKIIEKKKEIEILNKEFPTLKRAIEEWQSYESEE